MHSLQFIAVLDDCNDSKEAGNDRVQEEGEKERKRRVNGAREKERETKGEGSERRKRGKRRVNGAREKERSGERGARSTCTLYERNPRRRRWAVVHFMHAYARLYRIPCTPSPDYTEYHARLRLILLCPVYDSCLLYTSPSPRDS